MNTLTAREHVSRFLKIYRATFDYTQQEMAQTLGCSISTYNQAEQGVTDYGISFLDKITEALKVSVTEIF